MGEADLRVFDHLPGPVVRGEDVEREAEQLRAEQDIYDILRRQQAARQNANSDADSLPTDSATATPQ